MTNNLLAPEDGIIDLAIHSAFNHQMSLSCPRSLIDIGLLAQQGINWSIIAARACDWRMYNAVAFVTALWNELFHLIESQAAVRRCRSLHGSAIYWAVLSM